MKMQLVDNEVYVNANDLLNFLNSVSITDEELLNKNDNIRGKNFAYDLICELINDHINIMKGDK